MIPSLIIFVGLLAAPATQPGVGSRVSPGREAAVRSAIAGRLAGLSNVRIAYEMTFDFPLTQRERETIEENNDGHVLIRSNGTYRFAEQLSLLGGMTRLDSELLEHVPLVTEPPLLRPVERAYVFAPDRAQKLEWEGTIQGERQIAKGWERHRAGLQPSLLELALGMRALEDSSSRLTDANFRAMNVIDDGPDRVKLVAKDDLSVITWILDRRYGYAPVAYSWWLRSHRCVIAEMTMTDFRQVGKWQFPYVVNYRSFVPQLNSTMRLNDTEDLSIKEYRFNSADNNPDLYWIEWPEGAMVRDESSNVDLVERQGVLRPAGRP